MPTYTGHGKLQSVSGESFGEVDYYVEYAPRTPQHLGHIEGHISSNYRWFDAMQVDGVVLVMENGMRWDCALANNSGRLVNRGGLHEADGNV